MPNPSVVRIYATTQEPDYDSPWQSTMPSSSTGSGVVIGPGRVLTGAHVVANATFLQVQRMFDPAKAVARVAAICHDCDLALLEVDADTPFGREMEPAEIGELPDLRDRVSVVGFPVGGDEVSVTEGVVSRIEVQRYSHSQRYLLAVTVDAAINRGNSGGPVFSPDGRVVGVAFQKLDDAEAIGEMVPPPIIKHFLTRAQSDPRPSIPALGVRTQLLENPTLRRTIGLREDESGVRVAAIDYGGSAWQRLEVGDAILEVDGRPIANNATVRFRDRYRTRYDVILGQKGIGDLLGLRVLRGGQRLDIELELRAPSPLVPRSLYDNIPTFFIYGGLVFQILTRDFLSTWNRWWHKAPKEFLHDYYSGTRSEQRREVVVLNQILADEINAGYEDLYSESVVEVNGRAPSDMADFVSLVEQSDDLVQITMSRASVIVLEPKAVRAANARILERYRIPCDRSPDLLAQ